MPSQPNTPALPAAPPFTVRARVVTPLDDGRTLHVEDARLDVDLRGRIAAVRTWAEAETEAPWGPLFDLRPLIVLPGLVDLHMHIPQLPNAGVGDGLDLLSWLVRYTLPLERRFDRSVAARRAPLAFAAMAAAGTTTVAAYVTSDPGATDAAFEAAEAHGIRAILGHVLMDRAVGEGAHHDVHDTAVALDASERLCARWHGRDGGRLRYAFTPRFAVSCTAEMLEQSVRLAAVSGAHWQTHLSEDTHEIDEVRAAFPDALDYLDVYERAGALELGPRALFAHAIHLSEREVGRLAECRAAVAHCPASNLFLPSGIMPLARYLEAGVRVGLGSDVSGGPTLSIFETMRVGAYADTALRTVGPCDDGAAMPPRLNPFDWLRLGTLGGARAIGLGEVTGSLEAGKEADFIAVDPALVEPIPGDGANDDPAETISRLVFRTHPAMVRGAWVRGRLLPAGAPAVGGTDSVAAASDPPNRAGRPGPSGAGARTSRHLDEEVKPGTASARRREHE